MGYLIALLAMGAIGAVDIYRHKERLIGGSMEKPPELQSEGGQKIDFKYAMKTALIRKAWVLWITIPLAVYFMLKFTLKKTVFK